MLVIQRRCGERTEEVYLSSYGDSSKIFTVTGTDLFNVMINGLQLAKDINKEDWTLFVDADMRLYDNALIEIQKILNGLNERYYNVGFALDDKFLKAPIYGVHAQSNLHIDKALNWINQFGKNSVKAESKNIKTFCTESNLLTKKINLVVGSHDFGQYYKDIYWKFLIRGIRRIDKLSQTINEYKSRKIDIEDEIALEGLKNSINFPNQNQCKRNLCDIGPIMDKYHVEEKDDMHISKELEDDKIMRYENVFELHHK